MLKVAIIFGRGPRWDEVWVTDILEKCAGISEWVDTYEEALAFARKYDVPIISMQGAGIFYTVEQLHEALLMYLEILPSGEIIDLKPDPYT